MFWFGPRLVAEAACGDVVSVDRYLRAGDEVNERNEHGSSALHVAAQYNHTAVLDLVLGSNHVDVNLQDWKGKTALMKAAEKGNLEIVDTLCKRPDIDVNTRDIKGQTALMYACGHLDVVKILLNVPHLNMRLASRSNCNAFHVACGTGKTKVVRTMVNNRRAFDQLTKADLKFAIYLAKVNGHMEITRIVLKQLYMLGYSEVV